MTTTAKNQYVDLLEYQSAGKFRVDREAGVIRNVKLIGLESSNSGGKRRYPKDTLSRARNLYEGAAIYIDHVTDPTKAAVVRSQRDHWGEVRDVSERADGLYGDVHYLKKHSQTEEILERAERFPNRVACSHSARAAVEYRQGYEIVTDIELVRSVDLVTQPATTKTLFESVTQEGRKTMLIKDVLAGLSNERRVLRSVEVIESAIASNAAIGQLTVDVQEADTAEAVRACLVAATAELVESQSDDEAADRLASLLPKPKKATQTQDVTEAHSQTVAQLAKFQKELDVRDALARHGLSKIDVESKQIEALESCADLKAMCELVESWPSLNRRPLNAPRQSEANPGSKLRRVLLESEESDRNKSYDELRKEIARPKA